MENGKKPRRKSLEQLQADVRNRVSEAKFQAEQLNKLSDSVFTKQYPGFKSDFQKEVAYKSYRKSPIHSEPTKNRLYKLSETPQFSPKLLAGSRAKRTSGRAKKNV